MNKGIEQAAHKPNFGKPHFHYKKHVLIQVSGIVLFRWLRGHLIAVRCWTSATGCLGRSANTTVCCYTTSTCCPKTISTSTRARRLRDMSESSGITDSTSLSFTYETLLAVGYLCKNKLNSGFSDYRIGWVVSLLVCLSIRLFAYSFVDWLYE